MKDYKHCNSIFLLLARDVIYTSRAYATMSVSVCLSIRLSVTEVHWVAVHAGKRGGVISTTTYFAMLATGPLVFFLGSTRVLGCTVWEKTVNAVT